MAFEGMCVASELMIWCFCRTETWTSSPLFPENKPRIKLRCIHSVGFFIGSTYKHLHGFSNVGRRLERPTLLNAARLSTTHIVHELCAFIRRL